MLAGYTTERCRNPHVLSAFLPLSLRPRHSDVAKVQAWVWRVQRGPAMLRLRRSLEARRGRGAWTSPKWDPSCTLSVSGLGQGPALRDPSLRHPSPPPQQDPVDIISMAMKCSFTTWNLIRAGIRACCKLSAQSCGNIRTTVMPAVQVFCDANPSSWTPAAGHRASAVAGHHPVISAVCTGACVRVCVGVRGTERGGQEALIFTGRHEAGNWRVMAHPDVHRLRHPPPWGRGILPWPSPFSARKIGGSCREENHGSPKWWL